MLAPLLPDELPTTVTLPAPEVVAAPAPAPETATTAGPAVAAAPPLEEPEITVTSPP